MKPLFDVAPMSPTPSPPLARREARIAEPQRVQCEVRFEIPDDMVPATHPARILWNVLGMMDLTAFGKDCGSVEGGAGRSLKSPRMLLTLWMYAIVCGVGSAREIARLVKSDTSYRWIVGDLEVSHHKLSSFRIGFGDALNALMTDVLASLLEKRLLSLALVSQDGTRTRASASAPSFRTYGGLLQCREQAALHLKAVLASAGDPEHTRAQHARREAAARDFQQRVADATATVLDLQQKRTQKADPPRVSTTDAEARVMKMGDGGFRPAFNVQYATAGSELGGPRTIVGVTVTNLGSDMGSLTPMVAQIQERTGKLPKVLLADGGHAKCEDIVSVKKLGIDAVVPPADNAKSIEQLRREGAAPELIAWRERMETPEAKQLYRARAGLCELPNAHQKTHHGIGQFLVKGIDKVTCVILFSVIASNIMQNAVRLLG